MKHLYNTPYQDNDNLIRKAGKGNHFGFRLGRYLFICLDGMRKNTKSDLLSQKSHRNSFNWKLGVLTTVHLTAAILRIYADLSFTGCAWIRQSSNRSHQQTSCYLDNLIPEPPNTAHNCRRHRAADASLTSARSGNVVPVPETSILLGVGIHCLHRNAPLPC
jgi:hypothetical protein